MAGFQCTVMLTSVSTAEGSMAVQFRDKEVPWYTGPLGELRFTVGAGTVREDTDILIHLLAYVQLCEMNSTYN